MISDLHQRARRSPAGAAAAPKDVRTTAGGWRWAAQAVAALAMLSGCNRQAALPAAAGNRPNALVVCIDALRADRLGLYGASPSPSPALDALARDSIVFTDATSVASWTKPSVPSILTGLYPDEHGVFDNAHSQVDSLSPNQPTLATLIEERGWRTAAFVENEQLLRRLSGLDRGFSVYVDEAGRPPEIADRFLNWSGHDPTRPWFAYLHFLDPHFPYAPDDFLFDEDEDARLRLRLAQWDFRGEFWWLLRDRVNTHAMSLDEEALDDLDRLYRLEISEVDAVVGRMLAALALDGTLDRTLVVVTADHGEGFLERGRIDHGYGPYRELLHVPLIVRLPGRAHAGARSDVLAQNLDVAATVLDVLGLPAPPAWSSRSLVAAIESPSTMRTLALAQERHGHSLQVAARDARFTYVRSELTPEAGRRHASFPASAVPGTRVRAHGIFDGKRFVAGSIKRLAPGDPDIEMEGPIESIDADARSVRLFGIPVIVGDGVSDGERGLVTLADLAVARHVRVHGAVEDGRFEPTKIELVDRGPIEIEGVVRGVAATAGDDGDGAIDLGGIEFLVDPKVRWSDFPDKPAGRHARPAAPASPRIVEELYDRRADPAELTNVATTRQEELTRLRGLGEAARGALRPRGDSGSAPLDHDARERLRALGYVE